MTPHHHVLLPGGGQLSARIDGPEIDGPETAPWVVFANSVLTDMSVWDAQAKALSNRFRVLRYDQRGHGGSSLPENAMRFEDYGADLLALLAHLEVTRCIFVGLSMGVPTGLAAARVRPDLFSAFVAVDGVSRSAPGREAFWAERRETAQRDGMAQIASDTVPRWLPGVNHDDPRADRLRDMIAATPVEGFAAATNALSSYDQNAALSVLSCPVLGVAGALDGAMPDAMRRQFGDLPDARIATIPDAGHLPNFQSPDAFNGVLEEFLDAVVLNQKESR